MRTYNQTPSDEQLAPLLSAYASSSIDQRLYRVEYMTTAKGSGNKYTVSTVGYKEATAFVTFNTRKTGGVTRYRVRNPVSTIDIGPLLDGSVIARVEKAEAKKKISAAFISKLGSTAKSLDW